jgi:chromosomal replication initiator protein
MDKLYPTDAPTRPGAAPVPQVPEDDGWLRIKQRLSESLTPDEYATWIEPLDGRIHGGNEILIGLPNLVFYQGFHDRFLYSIEQCKSDLGLDHLLLRFEVEGADPIDELSRDFPEYTNGDATAAPSGEAPDGAAQGAAPGSSEAAPDSPQAAAGTGRGFSRALSRDGHLNRNFTFDSFIRGDSNQFAVATCLSAAENPGRAYNPLFIYGSSGLGKTHLLHAVGNAVLRHNADAVVTYITSEIFMNEMVYCLRFNKMIDFRQKYRNCDVLLVDDIHFISGRRSTQEEFFHTFNSLHSARKQIVITSDIFPRDIPDIEDRLRNRFQWGLIADIQPPSTEHRIAILLSKAEVKGIDLPYEVAEYIAKIVRRNVRELEGALNNIQAHAKFNGESISLDLAMRTFRDIMGEAPKRLTIETIQKTVADHFKLRVTDLKSKRRQRNIAVPRQIAMYLSRKLTSASTPDIGERFGGKDHTTVLHNVKKIEESLAHDFDLKAHVDALERRLEQMH